MKSLIGQGWGGSQMQSSSILSLWNQGTLPVYQCIQQGISLSPRIQSFYWGFIMEIKLIKSFAMWLNSVSNSPAI